MTGSGDSWPRADVLLRMLGHSEAHPDAPAAADRGCELSYGELRREADRFGANLAERGVGVGDRVALHLPNSVDYVVAALGCLWIGAAFVPLAVGDPEIRRALVLEDCDPALVVAGPDGLPSGLAATWRASRVGDLRAGRTSDAQNPPRDPGGDDPAYMIYTSGTTGVPKGVVISRAAFAHAVGATVRALGLGSATRSLCVSPFHFDGSFLTVFPTLAVGGSLVIPPRDALLFPRNFFDEVARERITYTSFSPSYLRLLLADRRAARLAQTALATVGLGGEAISAADVLALWSAAPQVRVFNRYGPTETTMAVTDTELTREVVGVGIVPIGRPHPGITFHIADGRGRMVEAPDVVGELYIEGPQLMLGYWGAPELTDQVVRTDLLAGRRLYRTGDLVYRRPAGDYVYVDRADRVVKRNGVRISLVEVTESLRATPGVAAAVCSAFDDGGRLGIVGFVVTEDGVGAADVRREARSRLPDTMLPDRLEVVACLPMTAGSKVDERRLLADAGLEPASRAGASTRRDGSVSQRSAAPLI